MSSEGILKLSPNFTKHSKVSEALDNGGLDPFGSKIKQDTVGGGKGESKDCSPHCGGETETGQ